MAKWKNQNQRKKAFLLLTPLEKRPFVRWSHPLLLVSLSTTPTALVLGQHESRTILGLQQHTFFMGSCAQST
jgi:hypothetical protein